MPAKIKQLQAAIPQPVEDDVGDPPTMTAEQVQETLTEMLAVMEVLADNIMKQTSTQQINMLHDQRSRETNTRTSGFNEVDVEHKYYKHVSTEDRKTTKETEQEALAFVERAADAVPAALNKRARRE